jgi:hypothetical protein
MVKKYSIIVVFALVSLCSSCQRFRVLEVGGETILKNPARRSVSLRRLGRGILPQLNPHYALENLLRIETASNYAKLNHSLSRFTGSPFENPAAARGICSGMLPHEML